MALFRGKGKKKPSELIYYRDAYYGSYDCGALDKARAYIGDYVIVLGGTWYSMEDFTTSKPNVITINKSLTYTVLSDLLSVYREGVGVTIGNYALFGSAAESGRYTDWHNYVYAYNSSLTRSVVTGFTEVRALYNAACINNKAIFAGGTYDGWNSLNRNSAEIYDSSLTHSFMSNFLTTAPYGLSSSFVGDYILFAGGHIKDSPWYTACVDAYDELLTKINNVSPLSAYKYGCLTASIGDYSLIAGGYTNNGAFKTVDTYNKSLTKGIAEDLTYKLGYAAYYMGTHVNNNCVFKDRAVFVNPQIKTNNGVLGIDMYDKKLVKTYTSFPKTPPAERNTSSDTMYYKNEVYYGIYLFIGDYFIVFNAIYEKRPSSSYVRIEPYYNSFILTYT